MVGCYGDIVFEVSDKKLLTFSDLARKGKAEWAKHKILNHKPRSEFLGSDLDTLTFTINYSIWQGVFPQTEMNRWWHKKRRGAEEFFVIGHWALGMNKWAVADISNPIEVILNDGRILKASVDITLEERMP